MSVTPFDSAIYRGLLSDDELARLFSDDAELRGLLDVEAALARAEGQAGVIPRDAAATIDAAARALTVKPADLAGGTTGAGVPVMALVAQLRKAAGEAGPHVHWGATSQDIVDTALVLRLKAACHILQSRLAQLANILAAQAAAHCGTVMAGRTRFQQAVPTTYGLKAAGWLSMLVRHQARLTELQSRLFVVQFGGAAGTLASLGADGVAVAEAFAKELNLAAPASPWHTQRDSVAEFAGWLSLVSGSLGKIGRDVLLMAQSEVGEARPAAGGGSSTMPQKANPIAAEMLVALAQANAGQLATMHAALGQEHERGGSGWTLEWLSLPQMVLATGAGLAHAIVLIDGLVIDAARMRATIEATDGLMLAEAATFALARHMPRPEAERLVSAACKAVAQDRTHLCDVLKTLTDAPLDYAALRDPRNYLGSADAFVERVLAEAKRAFPNIR
ncbi:MAG TPA: 3-carboxy-cis,cis-muconate cycloisomerase [Alphaproteobacteria bacterium]|jgi:3-carboxy-cis,cis-muconate cycloisomerase